MCIGFCFPFNLEIQEWIIGGALLALIAVSIWKDVKDGKFKIFRVALKKQNDKRGIYNGFHVLQKSLHYVFRGFVIRQVFDPYILFPLFLLMFWILKLNNAGTTDLVLTLTLAAIIWYSRETLVLREKQWESNKIAKKANEIAIGRPLIFIIKEDNGDYVSIKNFGNNTAKNVLVKFVVNEKVEKRIEFPVVVPKSQEIPYRIEKKIISLIDACDPSFLVEIEYDDLFQENSYCTKFILDEKVLVIRGKGRFKIISDEKIKPCKD